MFWRKKIKKILVQVAPEPSTVEMLRHLILPTCVFFQIRSQMWTSRRYGGDCRRRQRTGWLCLLHHAPQHCHQTGLGSINRELLGTKNQLQLCTFKISPMIESGYKRRRHGTATVWARSSFCWGTTSRLWGLWHGLQLSHRGGISLDCKRWCAKVETWNPESETWELADMELETGRAEFGTVTVPSDSIICNSAKILTKE